MKKALIIIPYFGKLPVWFQTFINSCDTDLLDFLVITDDETNYDYPDHFKVKYQKFGDFALFFEKRVGRSIYLGHPYKLCDYKPLYGKVFTEDVQEYKYWGYCDIDLVFGDIDNFLSPFLEEGFDKFSRFGHFSLFRNTKEINELYLSKSSSVSFDFVRKTTVPCLFDEIAINTILRESGKKFVESQLFHNVNMNYKNFAVGNGLPKSPQLILKNGKKLYLAELVEGHVTYHEFFYIHLMWRNTTPAALPSINYAITVDGFLPYEDEELLSLFERYGKPVDAKEEKIYNSYLKKAFVKSKIRKLKRELYHYNLRGVYNLISHFYMNK